MSKILFFFLGLLGGIALCAVLYLQASAKYNIAQNTPASAIAASEMKTAQLMWPPYIMDTMFQTKLRALSGKGKETSNGPSVTIFIAKDTSAEKIEEFTNQLEVMDGVESVTFSTLDDPITYIKNMTALPVSDKYIVDYLTVRTDSSIAARQVADISEVQDFVMDVTSPRIQAQ